MIRGSRPDIKVGTEVAGSLNESRFGFDESFKPSPTSPYKKLTNDSERKMKNIRQMKNGLLL